MTIKAASAEVTPRLLLTTRDHAPVAQSRNAVRNVKCSEKEKQRKPHEREIIKAGNNPTGLPARNIFSYKKKKWKPPSKRGKRKNPHRPHPEEQGGVLQRRPSSPNPERSHRSSDLLLSLR
jgi:hypothetical protein